MCIYTHTHTFKYIGKMRTLYDTYVLDHVYVCVIRYVYHATLNNMLSNVNVCKALSGVAGKRGDARSGAWLRSP